MYLGLSPNVKANPGRVLRPWGKLLSAGLLCFTFLTGGAAWAKAPYSASEIRAVETSEETQIRELRNEEIKQLRIALGRRSPVHRRADLYFRLAEIYMEAYHTEFLLEGRAHEKRLEKGVSDKFIDRSISQPSLRAGIQACKEILGFGIRYEKLDQIYYFLGFYYGELDDRKESSKYFEYLTQHFQNSPYVGVAYKELGENFYNAAQFSKAVEYIEHSLRRSPPERTPPILHKLAWCYYRTKQYDRAISTMKDAISTAAKYPDKYTPLKNEALRDMATLMTERGRVEEAIHYFQETVGDSNMFPKILEKLGRQYERNVEIEKAIVVYETLLKTSPESEVGFRVLVKLIELDLKQKRFAEVIKRLRSSALPSGGSPEIQTEAQNLRVMIRKTATEHHRLYRKNQDRHDLEIAETFYAAYLEHFLKKDDPKHDTPEILMYLAEVKREFGKSREVAQLYRQVVISKDKRYAKEAGALWTASLVEAIKKEPSRAGQNDPSDLEKEYVEAADLLQSSLGDVPESRELALRVTKVLAGYKGTRSDAISRIKSIISRWPRFLPAITAAQLWLQLIQDRKGNAESPDELARALQALRGNSELLATDHSLNKGKFKVYLEEQMVKLKISIIAKQERDKDFVGAAKGYEEFAATSTDKEAAEKAYVNAISSYLKADSASDAVLHVIDVWSKRFPRSPKAIESLRVVATHALIHGKFELSASLFGKLGSEYKERDSLETSARFYDAIGDAERAQRAWASYLEIYKDSPHRWRIALTLARSQENAHLDSEAGRSYRHCAAGPPEFAAECNSRLADLYFRAKDIEQAKAVYRSVGAQGSKKKSDGASPFVGYARYRLAELSEGEVNFDPMRLPEAQLQKGLNQRLNFLEPLSRSYQSVVQVGGPWAIAALYRLALFALHFADEVDAIAPPPNARGNALQNFRRSLGSVSQPLREKAKSTLSQGYSKAVAISLFSPALPEVADHLADFRVSMPGRAQGSRGRFHLAGLPANGGQDGQGSAFQKTRDRLVKNAKDAGAWTDYGNLLWGDGKPLLAKIAYERALALNSRNAAVLNNLAVVKISSQGEEDWMAVAEGAHYFEEALRVDDFFIPAKMNLATLMNYYRIFPKAKLLWDQVLVRNSGGDAEAGLSVALQGVGNTATAAGSFQRAVDSGVESSSFVIKYHEAARESLKGGEGAGRCFSILDGISSVEGFEKLSVEHLKKKCGSWKK